LTCKRGTDTDTKTIKVTVLPPDAVISLKANGADTASIPYDGSVTIAWTIANATNCSINNGIGNVTGNSSKVESNLLSSRSYVLSCKDLQNRAVQKSVSVNVGQKPPVPRVTIRANNIDGYYYAVPSTPITLTWTIADAAACELQSSLFSGGKVAIDAATANGSRALGGLGQDRNFKLVCRNSINDFAEASVDVKIQGIAMAANGVNGDVYIPRGGSVGLTFAAVNVSSCILKSNDDSGNPLQEAIPLNFPTLVKPSGHWSKPYRFNCRIANKDNSIVESEFYLAVRVVGLDMTVNGAAGPITIQANTPVTVNYFGAEADRCILDDTSTPQAVDYELVPNQPNAIVVSGINSTRGLIGRCYRNGQLMAEVGYPVYIAPPPHLVSSLTLSRDKAPGVPVDQLSYFDDDWQVCLNGDGTVYIKDLDAPREVSKLLHFNFQIRYLDGAVVNQTIQFNGGANTTRQLGGGPGEWAGLTNIGPVILTGHGRVDSGSVLPIFLNSVNRPGVITQNCFKVSDSEQNQSGRAWVTVDFQLRR
jgi:hypothetical protein